MVEGKMAQRRVRAVVLQHLCENLTPLFVDTAHLRCASFLCQMDASFEVSFAPALGDRDIFLFSSFSFFFAQERQGGVR
jgi:hypothetical protein